MDWPHGIERVTMILLALGLPVAMTIVWYHGQSANRRISGPELSIISLLLVIGAFLFYTFAQPAVHTASNNTGASTEKSDTPVAVRTDGISIAVLPFANLSGDTSQEYFSDGITDEIMTALAKVQSLQIVARQSAYQFKGEKRDMRDLGKALNAQ